MIKSLDYLTLKKARGKKILLRIDLNSEISKGRILESPRIKASSISIKELKRKKAKVIILAHQGTLGKEDCLSLKSHCVILNKYTKVKFVNETVGKKAWVAINELKNGEALLLENTRFLKDELSPSKENDFINFFKEVRIDYYVNDAFSVSHRNHSSIVSLPKVFPSFIGRVFEKEFENIRKLKSKIKNALFVFGGVKTEDLLPIIKNQKVLTTGKLSILALKLKGYEIVKENGLTKDELKLSSKINRIKKNLVIPKDLGVDFRGRKEITLNDLPVKRKILDVGVKTIEEYSKEIKKSKAILIKGAPGMFESKKFEKGTKELLKAIEKSKAFCVASGGSISSAIEKFGINKKKLGYVSLSGGALIRYLAGEKLKGLEALKN
ncbi:MAG: phosphoglycerate kinase [Candidatus Pacearchaeota archaeon]